MKLDISKYTTENKYWLSLQSQAQKRKKMKNLLKIVLLSLQWLKTVLHRNEESVIGDCKRIKKISFIYSQPIAIEELFYRDLLYA